MSGQRTYPGVLRTELAATDVAVSRSEGALDPPEVRRNAEETARDGPGLLHSGQGELNPQIVRIHK